MATPRASFGATLALTVTLAVAVFALAMPVVMTALPAYELPSPFPDQHQRGETISYLLAYLVVLPLAVIAARRLCDRIAEGPNAEALTALAGLLAALLPAALIAVRAAGQIAGHDGVKAVFVAAALWWLIATVVLSRAARPAPWPPLLSLGRHTAAVWAVAAAAILGALLCFARLGSISPVGLALVLLAGSAAVYAYQHVRIGVPGRRWGAALDIVALLVVMTLVPDLVIFRPEQAARNLGVALETGIIQFHHDFLLGPANEVLHGHPMLVGTASQYGVTSIYLLAAWFQVAPIGYGTLGLLAGVLSALWFGAGYAIVRLAGVPRLLAAGAFAVAIVALVFNLAYPVGSLPQSGPLRFGLPMALVLAAVAGERFPRRERAARITVAAIVGLSAVWSMEAFAYTVVVFAAVAGVQAWLGRDAVRSLARRAVEALIACVAAHGAFALLTLAGSGSLPDWGEYLAYLREFLFGRVGQLTYDVARWTPGLVVGAGYLASAAAFAELARRRSLLMERERPAMVAIAGVTVYGAALLSYYVDRSQDHILVYVALPAVLTGVLWLGLLLRSGVPAPVRTAGLAFALAVAALVVAVAWSSVGDRLPRSLLAHALPGGSSLRGALARLWHPPPLAPAAPAGARALIRHVPGEDASLMMVSPDLGTEILLRSGRADRLGLGDPWEASFAASEEVPQVREAVDSLRPGARMLMDGPARDVLAKLRAQPGRDVLEDPIPALAPLQVWALQRIDARYRLQPVAAAPGGFTVVALRPRG
jgi:hypothetical protein